MAENVVVVGDLVLCAAGGSRAYVVALDKRSGQTVWMNRDRQERAAYGSPIIVTYGGVRQYIVLTQQSVISLDVKTGELLWRYPHETKTARTRYSPCIATAICS